MARLIVILLLLASCTHDKVVNHNQTDTIKYEEIYCPNCDGIGQVKMSAGSRVVLGILTLGPGALCDTESCSMCNGTGICRKSSDGQFTVAARIVGRLHMSTRAKMRR